MKIAPGGVLTEDKYLGIPLHLLHQRRQRAEGLVLRARGGKNPEGQSGTLRGLLQQSGGLLRRTLASHGADRPAVAA